jgi:hypothetical protein
MLKLLHTARISNFCIFLVDFSLDYKHIVLSLKDEFMGIPYMDGKFMMSSFQLNLNHNKISPVALDISQTVHEGLI